MRNGTGDGLDPHRGLDFDHIGAEVPQDTADKGPERFCHVQDAYAFQRSQGLSWLAGVIGAPEARLFTGTPLLDRHTQQL